MKVKALFLAFLIVSVCLPCRAEVNDKQQRSLREQIVIYNLINGLYLTDSQLKDILEKAKQVEDLRVNIEDSAAVKSAEFTDTLLALKQEVKKNEPEISGELARKVHQDTDFLHKLRKEYIDAVAKAVEHTKTILTDNQLYIIAEFHPCLVPPQGPARFGQVSSGENIARLFRRVKSMPEQRYQLRKYDIADYHLEKISLKYPHLSQLELNDVKDKIIELLERIRNISEVEFSLKQEQILQELKNIVPAEKEVDVDKRIAKFLLSPEAITVLEEKLSLE